MKDTTLEVSYPELPVSRLRGEILSALEGHQVVVVVGDTGSGKTTQLPKMAYEFSRKHKLKGKVGCTQPRRLAAASVSNRVSEELKVDLGRDVGYQVRFQDKTSRDTRIKFMTDGILLAETQGDIDLKQYSVLIIDEAHERSLNIDFLLGYLKNLLARRKDLKILISSATLDAGGFSEFFDGAPIVQVEGRTFPVEVEYLPQSRDEDMARHVARAVDVISRTDRSGDILVFLPGEREIRECADVLIGRNWAGTEILPLFARLGLNDQQKVFNPQGGVRRVILATNVAETSLTIPGIIYVVDTGVARVSRWSPGRQVQRLQIEKTSQASANQRKGRCGRICEGICVRLYDEEDFEGRQEFSDPEIRRSSLAGVILRMKALGLPSIEDFPFLDPPSSKHISEGYRTLREIGALDEVDELTKVGEQLSRLPVEPRLGRMLLESVKRHCFSEMLVIVSGLSVMDPKERPADKQKEADESHKKWDDESSDFLSILNLWRDLMQFKNGRKWRGNQLRKFCRQRYVNFKRVQEWDNLYHELAVLCRQTFKWHASPLDESTLQWADADAIHKSLLAGMPKQIGIYDRESRAYKGVGGKEFAIFPGSGVFGQKKPTWLLAYDMVDTTRLWARRVARLDPAWVEEVAGHLCRSRYHSAAWNKKQGAVYAKETVLCGGLKVVDGRNVHFGKIDPQAAREVFIREGLLGGGMKRKPDVLKQVDLYREEVRELEQKLRRIDGIWSEESVITFLEERLPSDLCTAKAYHRWESKHASKLECSVQDFVYEDLEALGAKYFPDTLTYAGDEYTLYYRVAPGEVDDGVTLGVHVDQLGLMPEWLPEWGVPGQLEERAFLMLKSLPKSERVACNPAAEAAQEFAELWQEREPQRSFYAEFAAFLSRRSGMAIDARMFKKSRLPEEMVMKVWVCDDEGNELAMGTEVLKLKDQLAEMMVERFEEETGAEWEMHGLKSWGCGDLPEFIETARGRAYPALVDEGDGVGVKVCADEREAARSHLAGCVRLFLMRHADQAKYVSKNMPLSMEAKMYMPLLGGKGVNQADILRAIVEGVFVVKIPRNQASFEKVADQGRGDLYHMAGELCGKLDQMIANYRKVEHFLEDNRSDQHLSEIVEDMQEEVRWLLRDGFMAQTGWLGVPAYDRFFAGMLDRIGKLKSQSLMRDLEKMDRVLKYWLPWHDQWKERGDEPAIIELGMAIEQYRLSLYAPQLAGQQKVSEKILTSMLEAQGIRPEALS
ncbi:ATP-dependent helicase HrpA [Rubritalea squalenifaciens DSM 18772]|uniref:RNA helicase n=1 Tax=Rubritalea squalenifaciens DSM 18772 TaxID=1123071 RepID=A0A1M6H9Q7_9BACT|nr:ATP-dependent RNA helicase HrpA [Rubritalea squalenifaciens]SHJ18962.1 ATP-dependent helicase HrpA [Rubritalea squalenifaciens DSM 18772]